MNADRHRRAYFDSSILAKTYLNEEGSRRARELVRRHQVVSSIIAPVEVVATLFRQRSAGNLRENIAAAILSRLKQDRGNWELIQLDSEVITRAEEVVGGTAVRTLDALHVACALSVHELSAESFLFFTADGRQAAAARAHGLDVIAL